MESHVCYKPEGFISIKKMDFGSLIELSFVLLSFIIYFLSIYAIDLLPWSEWISNALKNPVSSH